MRKIAIFRNQLFKNSESFITNQADEIDGFDIVYLGRRLVGENKKRDYYVINEKNTYRERTNEIINALSTTSIAYNKVVKDLDLIHAHFAIDAVYALPLLKKKNMPLITTLHGFDVTVQTKKIITSMSPSLLNYKIKSASLKRDGSLFLCVSDFIRNKALEAGFPEEKLITHYIGINSNIDAHAENTIKTRTFLHIARLVEKKGTIDIIEAVSKIQNKLNGFKVKIIGDGPLFNEIKNRIKNLNLETHIEMLGEIRHDEVIDIIKRSSVLLVPSVTAQNGDSEGLPTVILEAAAASLPTIGTYHAGIPEAVLDGRTGFLVGEKKSIDLAERMLYFIENESKISEYGIAAKKFVNEKFNLKIQTKLLQEYYSKLLK